MKFSFAPVDALYRRIGDPRASWAVGSERQLVASRVLCNTSLKRPVNRLISVILVTAKEVQRLECSGTLLLLDSVCA